METKLTAQQVYNLIPSTYLAYSKMMEEVPADLMREDFGTTSTFEIWEKCTFEITPEGILLCTQSNDVTLAWVPSAGEWDDI